MLIRRPTRPRSHSLDGTIAIAATAIALLACCDLARGEQSAPPPIDLRFSDSGTYTFGAEYEGSVLRIIAVGSGGGGSGAMSRQWLARTGAGGGSGAVVVRYYTITGDRTVAWTIGTGGAGGMGWGDAAALNPGPRMNGADGQATTVIASFGAELDALGGNGGLYLQSGYNQSEFAEKLPPLGGIGAMPRGRTGADGIASLRLRQFGTYEGGFGGRLSDIDVSLAAFGAGGDGGDVVADKTFPASGEIKADTGLPGAPGSNGLVILQVGTPEWTSLGASAGALVPPSPAALVALTAELNAACAQPDVCTAADMTAIARSDSLFSLSPEEQAGVVGAISHIADKAYEKLGGTALGGNLLLIAELAVFSEGLNSKEQPFVHLDPTLATLNEGGLNELYGQLVVAHTVVEHSALSPERDLALAELEARAAAVTKEIERRRELGIPAKLSPSQYNRAVRGAVERVEGGAVDDPGQTFQEPEQELPVDARPELVPEVTVTEGGGTKMRPREMSK
jgi:hypothetical protein